MSARQGAVGQGCREAKTCVAFVSVGDVSLLSC
jgi:hypothetical protein